jgi:hypothetical protein
MVKKKSVKTLWKSCPRPAIALYITFFDRTEKSSESENKMAS